jgi:colanic acid biosynthesis glycosyl transferase WcaI
MKRTVYFFNRFYRPDPCATAQILGSLCDRLERAAFQVKVVCGSAGYLEARVRRPLTEVVDGVPVIRLRSTAFGRQRPIGRLLDYASLHVSMAVFLLRQVRTADVVVVTTDPPLIGVTVALARFFKPFKVVAWCQDVFPEIAMAAVTADHWEGRRPVGRLALGAVCRGLSGLRGWRDWSLRQAEAVVAISDPMAAALRHRGVGDARVRVIENWAVQSEAEASTVATLRRHWGLTGNLVLGHFGNLGRGHDFRTVLRAIEAWADVPGVEWVFVGGGHGGEILRSRFEGSEAPVRFFPYLPLEILGSGLQVPDLHWLSLRPAMEAHLFPSKFYGILKAGKPVLLIGGLDSALGRLIQTEEIGMVVEEGDSDQLHALLRALAADPGTLARMAERSRALYERAYSGEWQQDQWATLLTKVTTGSG